VLLVERVSMTNPVAIAKAVTAQRPDVDLIALVGGGGDWLSVCSDRQVCAAVAEAVGVPLVSAVGHAENHPLVEAVVHQAFDTPSLFGTWLKARAVAATDETARQVASLEGQREQLQQVLQAAEVTRRAAEAQVQTLQRRQKTYYWGAVAVVVIVVSLMILIAR
jgi:exonuclease VII large subunit